MSAGAEAAGLSAYSALVEAVNARRRAPRLLKGVDRAVATLSMKLKHRRARLAALLEGAGRIDALAPAIRSMSDAALDAELDTVRASIRRGRATSDVVERALALVREAASRETGEEAYRVQLAGALALVRGRIVEMVTGEGKTLTGSLAVPLLSWRAGHVHVLTVNDYLAERDAESRRDLYSRCGVSVGAIVQEQSPIERSEVYRRGAVYGTPKQIAADYLRDQIRLGSVDSAWSGWHRLGGGVGGGPLVPGLHACLVDEADAVLIDEGVTPLIIARAREADAQAAEYARARSIASELVEGEHYRVEHVRKRAVLTGEGRESIATAVRDLPELAWRVERRREELVRQALVAAHCYLRGRQYEVVDGQVVIVDEYTGRFLPDRSWEHGLHQAVEAKEGLEATADRETLARISFQRFFRSYRFLAGMTGTAADAAHEMATIYSRPVTVIPTNRPVIREQRPMRIFGTQESKWRAVVESIEAEHAAGRPVLVGTRSIEASELLSERLTARGLVHELLNAHQHAEEADTVARAGEPGRIMVATNMAGRGTDIKLTAEARDLGGLHVILTEPHGARRVDRQFIGRAGRQGDPGSAQVFASLEDDLPAMHTPGVASAVGRSGKEELTGSRVAMRVVQLAQSRQEARDRRSRASVLRQDDWVDRYLPGG
ncbi:MAG: hypothetical protein AAGB48_06990 [Planctomycetota bacterium]